MRKQLISVLLALAATGGLAACTPDTGTGQPSATPGTTTGSPEASSPGTVGHSGHRNPRYRHSRHPGARDYTARRRNDSPGARTPCRFSPAVRPQRRRCRTVRHGQSVERR
jgi:hypothetical protein